MSAIKWYVIEKLINTRGCIEGNRKPWLKPLLFFLYTFSFCEHRSIAKYRTVLSGQLVSQRECQTIPFSLWTAPGFSTGIH